MKNEHPRVLPSEQDDIVNSLNYEEPCSQLVTVFFLAVTDWYWLITD